MVFSFDDARNLLRYGGLDDGGRVTIPDLPGAGYEAKANLFAILEST